MKSTNNKPKVNVIDEMERFGVEFESDKGKEFRSWSAVGYTLPIFFTWNKRKWMIASMYFTDLDEMDMCSQAIELVK